MSEQTFKKAGDLNPATYTDELIIVVSNPAIPDDPVTLDSEQILNQAGQSKTIEFNRVVTLSVLHTLTLDDRTNTVASNPNYTYNVAWYITEM